MHIDRLEIIFSSEVIMTDTGPVTLLILIGEIWIVGWLIFKAVGYVWLASQLRHGSNMAWKRNSHILKYRRGGGCLCEVCTDSYYTKRGFAIGRDGSINETRTLTGNAVDELFVPN